MSLPTSPPVVVAPSPTPFRVDGSVDLVDFEAIERNVARWLKTPLSGFVLNTENGEESFLSEAERYRIIQTVSHVVAGERLVIAGIDNPSVTETLRLADHYAEGGADLLRLRIPRLTKNVRGYFEQVAPRASLPVIIIHQMAPGTFLTGGGGSGAPAELIGELAALDNVYGYIAGADLRFEARARLFVPADKPFWTANGSLLSAGGILGANGACLMLGNVFPEQCQQVLQYVAAGELAQAHELQSRLIEADWQILSRGAAGIKAAMNLLGYETGAPRRPSLPCSPAEINQIRTALVAAGAQLAPGSG